MSHDRIPLFPLELVLFPAMPLPLHIFEPRYKLMIGRCLERHAEFGVVWARAEEMARLGTTAEIIKVVRRYPDGRMDILTMGQTRYRVLRVFEEEPYLEAEIEYLDDDTQSAPPDWQAELWQLYERCHRLLTRRAPRTADPDSGVALSFQIARELSVDLPYQQELLEMEREADRQQSLRERLQQWLPELVELDRRRRAVGGNGRGRS